VTAIFERKIEPADFSLFHHHVISRMSRAGDRRQNYWSGMRRETDCRKYREAAGAIEPPSDVGIAVKRGGYLGERAAQ
jgi:hypothetical protein